MSSSDSSHFNLESLAPQGKQSSLNSGSNSNPTLPPQGRYAYLSSSNRDLLLFPQFEDEKSQFEQSVKQRILQTSTRRSWPVSLTEGCHPFYNPPSHCCWLPTWGFTGGENQLIRCTICSKGTYSSNTLRKSGNRVPTRGLTPPPPGDI